MHHLVLDFNGTIAIDGKLITGVKDLLTGLAENVSVHVITADTFGSAEKELTGIPLKLHLISRIDQGSQKGKLYTVVK